MKFKMNDKVFVVDHYSDIITIGKVNNIQITSYLPNDVHTEGLELVQYRVDNSWHYEDSCFHSLSAAKKKAIEQLYNKRNEIDEQLEYIRNMKE